MKILYITEQNLHNTSGISQKIRGQLKVWRDSGHEVEVVDFHSLTLFRKDSETQISSKSLNIPGRLNTFLRVWRNFYVLSQFVRGQKYDIVYSRTVPWSPGYFLISNYVPTIIEINSDDEFEARKRSIFTYLYVKFTRKMLLSSAKAFISVSRELAEKNKIHNNRNKVISNGHESSTHLARSSHSNIRLVFTGTHKPWHGQDKLLRLAASIPEFEFHIVGNFPQIGSAANVIYHGERTNKETLAIISECDIGVSSLALHRAGLSEASPLKSREYLAMGLPIIIAYNDTDLSEEDFVLNIGNTETNVEDHITEIKKFCCLRKNDMKITDEIRSFFEKNLSFSVKEAQRLAFFIEMRDKKQT